MNLVIYGHQVIYGESLDSGWRMTDEEWVFVIGCVCKQRVCLF